jgi:hypothetical protein
MQTLFVHLSALVGVLAFVNQLVRYAPLDRTIVVGVASGIAVYVVLMIGDVVIKRIVESSVGSEEEASTKGSVGTPGSDKSSNNQASVEHSAQAA